MSRRARQTRPPKDYAIGSLFNVTVPVRPSELRPLVLAPGARDAVVLVDVDDLPTRPLGYLAELTLLVRTCRSYGVAFDHCCSTSDR